MVGRAPWVGARTLNNQPHIHLTICGYLLDPNPLLKASGHMKKPPQGYGAGGFPAWGIPAGATLEFTLECLQARCR